MKFFIVPLFTVAPLSAAAKIAGGVELLKSISTTQNGNQQILGVVVEKDSNLVFVIQFLSDNPKTALLIITVLSYLWLLIFKALAETVRHYGKPTTTIDIGTALFLHTSIEHPVNEKAKRFAEVAKLLTNTQNSDKDSKEIFSKITQPEQQISLLAHASFAFLDHLDQRYFEEAGQIHGGLLKFENNKPIEWVMYHGKPSPSTTPEELDNPKSTVVFAATTLKKQVIPDIELAVKKNWDNYLPLPKNKGKEKGSLICYPIHHKESKSVPYVFSVYSEKPNYFKEDELFVKWGIEKFAERILLEHSLEIIKHRVGG